MKSKEEDIYDTKFVSQLFDRMSKTYGITNYISSFGFTEKWRKQCVEEINWSSDMSKGYDLMSGMGKSWHLVHNKKRTKIIGVDISEEMNKKARIRLEREPEWDIEIREEDILENEITSESADFIVSTFGLKTFSDEQLRRLAQEVTRILKDGGQISMIEISKPKNWILQRPYMFYLKNIIPLIGKFFQGNSSSYRMLGVYCDRFNNFEFFKSELSRAGLNVKMKSYFFGCATGIVGYK
jgi:demethylmenaquinone methyltransferase/2-methoxy-6-polyprenyl-1,4-benzoquinol methylase